MSADWLTELETPTPAFFQAFKGRPPADAARDAVHNLVPAVDWAGYLPHIPHGLLGLSAVFRLRPLLDGPSFLRILATQVHAFAHEARTARGLGAIGLGSGSRANFAMALEQHRPAIAWGEAMAFEAVQEADFRDLEARVERDMANVGHKGVLAQELGALHAVLGSPRSVGRRLLAVAAWLCASEPCDVFWYQRAAKRLEGARPVPVATASQPAETWAGWARDVCDCGLVDLLDRFAPRVRAGASGDLLAALVLAASEKQLDARRDLEGKTAWNFVCLARLARHDAPLPPESWMQAAALVNLFPTDEPEDRPRPAPPRRPAADPATGLLDAILDAEPLQAMYHAQELLDRDAEAEVLRLLAEAAATNDPAFNHSHQLLAVAAGAALAPLLPGPVRSGMLLALAKSLANSQGSTDLGRLADKALAKY